ncbi:hypothetical protein [Anaerostipes sp.]|uniref:hypothetical protein n=1 Tax=Anaerostipes sp. TaxID=1872530 RepID=UPI003FED9DCB
MIVSCMGDDIMCSKTMGKKKYDKKQIYQALKKGVFLELAKRGFLTKEELKKLMM